jgi:predicted nucleotidyltransferase
VQRITEQFRPLCIGLFGSRAHGEAAGPGGSLYQVSVRLPRRGEATAASDIDLLGVLPAVKDKRQAAIASRRALSDLPAAKDIVVTTPEELVRQEERVIDERP